MVKVSKVARVAKTFRMLVFKDRPTGAWVAVDATSYHVAQGKTIQEAVDGLFHIMAGTELLVWERRQMGERVIRWNCPMPVADRERAEARVKGTPNGFALNGVRTPDFWTFFKLDKKKAIQKLKKFKRKSLLRKEG